MEKQNDHKKFSKKIWVLSAGIIVILAIVLFAGIKNGFFLRKGDKILYAAYHTIKDQPETARMRITPFRWTDNGKSRKSRQNMHPFPIRNS